MREYRTGECWGHPITLAVEGMTPNGIEYYTELYSIDGVIVYLFKRADHTLEQVEVAKRWLKNQRDVVRFATVRITKELSEAR